MPLDTGSNVTMTTSNITITTQANLDINTTSIDDSDVYINRTVTDYMSPWQHKGEDYELGTSVIVGITLGSAAFIVVVGKSLNCFSLI